MVQTNGKPTTLLPNLSMRIEDRIADIKHSYGVYSGQVVDLLVQSQRFRGNPVLYEKLSARLPTLYAFAQFGDFLGQEPADLAAKVVSELAASRAEFGNSGVERKAS